MEVLKGKMKTIFHQIANLGHGLIEVWCADDTVQVAFIMVPVDVYLYSNVSSKVTLRCAVVCIGNLSFIQFKSFSSIFMCVRALSMYFFLGLSRARMWIEQHRVYVKFPRII